VFRMEYIIILLFWLIVAAAIHFHYRLKLYKNVKQTVVGSTALNRGEPVGRVFNLPFRPAGCKPALHIGVLVRLS